MNWSVFLKQLGKLTAAVVIWAVVIEYFDKSQQTLPIYLISIVTFVLFSLLIFLYAYNTSASDNLFSYNNVVIVSFIVKLIMSFGVILFFERIFHPEGDWHILHFVIVYLAYTIHEVYFLTRLARTSD